MKTKTRKLSWQYLDLAFKIQVSPRHDTAKLLLLFLADKSNDQGRSYHGYRSISAHLSKRHTAISEALRYLRDDLQILSWERGFGGRDGRKTNDYQLDLAAMKNLVADQGIFNPETGKLIREPLLPEEKLTSLPSAEVNLSSGAINSSAEAINLSSGKRDPLLREDLNPHRTPNTEPSPIEPTAAPNFFSDTRSVDASTDVERREPRPPVPLTPQGRTHIIRRPYLPTDPAEPGKLAFAIRDAISRELCRGNDPPGWNAERWTAGIDELFSRGYDLDDVRKVARYAMNEKVFQHRLMYAEGVPGMVAVFDELYVAANGGKTQ